VPVHVDEQKSCIHVRSVCVEVEEDVRLKMGWNHEVCGMHEYVCVFMKMVVYVCRCVNTRVSLSLSLFLKILPSSSGCSLLCGACLHLPSSRLPPSRCAHRINWSQINVSRWYGRCVCDDIRSWISCTSRMFCTQSRSSRPPPLLLLLRVFPLPRRRAHLLSQASESDNKTRRARRKRGPAWRVSINRG
jgi:hypothetical protein